jgi:hypothetical protein
VRESPFQSATAVWGSGEAWLWAAVTHVPSTRSGSPDLWARAIRRRAVIRRYESGLHGPRRFPDRGKATANAPASLLLFSIRRHPTRSGAPSAIAAAMPTADASAR